MIVPSINVLPNCSQHFHAFKVTKFSPLVLSTQLWHRNVTYSGKNSKILWTLKTLNIEFQVELFCSSVKFSSVQLLSRVWLFVTPWIAARQASPSITNSRSSLKFTPIKSVMPSSHLILCCPLLLLPPIPPSIRVNSLHQVTKVLEFQL